jgi:hypothetical protein
MAGSLLPLQIIELASSRKCRKIISHECEWAFRYQFSSAGAIWMGISHIFLLKVLKPFFFILESKSLLNLEIKLQQFYAKGRPFDRYHFQRLLVLAGLYCTVKIHLFSK